MQSRTGSCVFLRGVVALLSSGLIACSEAPPVTAEFDTGTTAGDAAPTQDGGTTFSAPDGSGISADDAGPLSCAKGTTGTRHVPGYIQIVLDGSGSMQGPKWSAVRSAVSSVVARWTAAKDPTFGFGVSIFPGSASSYPSVADVALAPATVSQQEAVQTRLSVIASGGTPSYAALRGNYDYLSSFDATAAGLPSGGKKILVFMSDGIPSDTCSQTPSDCWTLAERAKSAGIITYSVLFSDGTTDARLRAFMGTLAETGGGLAKPACTGAACAFEVDTLSGDVASIAKAFATAIEQARSSIDPCVLVIEKQPNQAFDTDLVNVTITAGTGAKSAVLKDPKDGWSYDDPADPTSVVLHGAACEQVKADSMASVELALGCPSITR